MKMKALVKSKPEPGIWLEEVPVPEIGINDVLIKIHKTSICGTDVHIYDWNEWAQNTIQVPMHVGHEFVGTVDKIGGNVRDFKPGDIVSGEGHLVCGRCRFGTRGFERDAGAAADSPAVDPGIETEEIDFVTRSAEGEARPHVVHFRRGDGFERKTRQFPESGVRELHHAVAADGQQGSAVRREGGGLYTADLQAIFLSAFRPAEEAQQAGLFPQLDRGDAVVAPGNQLCSLMTR